jgi:hypothetical protein
MKRSVKQFLFCRVIIACIFATFLPSAKSQDNTPSDLKHIMAAGVFLTASSIEREVHYPSVVHLKGNVEIKMKGWILRTDDADVHEITGEIEARGSVRLIPYPPIEQSAPAKK